MLDALRAGNFFVTSGEVLLHDYSIQGAGAKGTFVVDVDWTWPAEFVELVWGDGKKTGREIVRRRPLRRFRRITTASRSTHPARNGCASRHGIRQAMAPSLSRCICTNTARCFFVGPRLLPWIASG